MMAMKRARSKLKRSAQARRSAESVVHTATFIEHIFELRRRLFWIAVSVILFSIAAYFVQHQIIRALLAPAGDQPFAQTTPGGGLDFLLRVCLYTGLIISVPVIFNQFIKYFQPLIPTDAIRFIYRASIASWFLAAGGVAFGYFVGLPAALHFLLNQFTNPQIQTLINLQSYLSFVMIYLVGAAMLFQIPLVMLVINKIKPLKPAQLLGYERWVIVFAVVAGGILSPSPTITDQMLLAGPMIATYQIGILLVWLVNRRPKRPRKVRRLLEQDAAARQERLQQFQAARQAILASTVQRGGIATASSRKTLRAPSAAAALAPTAAASAAATSKLAAHAQPSAALKPKPRVPQSRLRSSYAVAAATTPMPYTSAPAKTATAKPKPASAPAPAPAAASKPVAASANPLPAATALSNAAAAASARGTMRSSQYLSRRAYFSPGRLQF